MISMHFLFFIVCFNGFLFSCLAALVFVASLLVSYFVLNAFIVIYFVYFTDSGAAVEKYRKGVFAKV